MKAIISPAGDSIVTSNNFVTFQSASINATDYKFIVDRWNHYPLNTPLNRGFQPGLTAVKLVAYNGACTDTAVVYYFNPGQFPSAADNSRRLYGYPSRNHEVTDLTAITTGGYILAGHRDYDWYLNEQQQGILIKTRESGCVDWGRKLPGNIEADIKIVKESADGGFFILASVDYRKFIARLDSDGNMLWKKSLTNQGSGSVIGDAMEALPDGGVAVMGHHPSGVRPLLFRLDNNGDIVWQKEFDFNISSIIGFNNILFKENYLYVGGNLGYNSFTNYDAFLTKIDYAGGQTIWTKKYTSTNGPIYLQGMIHVDSTLLLNINASSGITTAPSIGGYMRLDTSGQVLAATLVGETYIPNTLVGPYGSGRNHLVRSGKSFYILSAGAVSLSLQPGISYSTKLVKLDSNYQVSWVLSRGGAGIPRFFYNAPSPDEGVAIAGLESGSGYSPNYIGNLISLKIIDSSGGNPAADCWFGKQPPVIIPLTITPQSIQWTIDQFSAYSAIDIDFPIVPFYPEMRFKCPDYVDSCSYLKLSGPQTVCNLNASYTYQVHKNKACGQPTQWQIPSGVQVVSQTDNAVTVRLPAFGRYVIYGSNPLSCIPVQDSIVVTAASKSPPLNLGPDQHICPQNTTTLHAGPAFFAYEWQDGSTDSLLQVNVPGQYWVKVTDSCNNVFHDTINISAAPPIPISIGPDRNKCNNDTIRLKAPPGFINYSWSPNYNINTTTGQEVVVNPLVDTLYTITAEKTPGCFTYDTILISVNHSPAIYLGRDTSFCSGDSVVLNAGTGFQQYLWSNGLASPQIVVYNAGSYSVTGTTTEGCRSYDTIRIVNVFNNPVVHLSDDTTLCSGSSKTLNAGNFAAYLWQNGDTGPSFTVTSLGKYFVTVTDNNHCSGSDTLDITRLLPVPSGFLPPDTSLCTYGKLELTPLRPFTDYHWNNGATSSSITVDQPGLFWLEATDEDHCTGKDTMVIRPKDCLLGLYVPSAFTPNNDGKNDTFKPLLFGNIKQYRFSIYNRWGQLIFHTTEPGKGWDGLYNGYAQESSVYAWVCTYQLEGEVLKTEKGTVTLVR